MTIPIKTLILDSDISQHDVPYFRGAIIDAISEDTSSLFHNHLSDDALRYSYPLVQYKRIFGKAAVLCIGDACQYSDFLHTLNGKELRIGNKTRIFRTQSFSSDCFSLEVLDSMSSYGITDWIALNSQNFERYKNLASLNEKIQLLESILTGNILSLAKGLGVNIREEIKCMITDLPSSRIVTVKGNQMTAFNVRFMTNVLLPQYVGLGKNVSFGFGMITYKIK